MFLPVSSWESVAGAFGTESFPDSPQVIYAARLLSATFTLVGVFLVILALDPLKYGVMVPFTGIAAVILGAFCAAAGLLAKMPTWWYLGDALCCLVLGVLILVFWQQANQTSGSSSEPM
jgi:peptidoglycan/LPS O-acetylase OafA/YrhL